MFEKPGAVPKAILETTLAERVDGHCTQVLAVADTEVRKLKHDPSEVLTRALQPAIWLLLFGQVMAHVRGLDAGGGNYLDFLAPDILAQSVLFELSSMESQPFGNATSAFFTATWSAPHHAARSFSERRPRRLSVAFCRRSWSICLQSS